MQLIKMNKLKKLINNLENNLPKAIKMLALM